MEKFTQFTNFYLAKLKVRIAANKEEIIKVSKERTGEAYAKLEEKIFNRFANGKFSSETTVEEVLASISRGDVCAIAMFAIEPGRQSMSEPAQIEYAASANGRILKKAKGHQYVQYDGSIDYLESTRKNASLGAPKSLDFITTINGRKVYMTAKVTNCHYNDKVMTGGNQGTIKREMKQTAEAYDKHLKANPNADYDFVLLLDGSYFNEKNRAEVAAYAKGNPRVSVLTSDDLALLNT